MHFYTVTFQTATIRVVVKLFAQTDNSALFLAYADLVELEYKQIRVINLEKING